MKQIILLLAISTLFFAACTKSAVENNNGSSTFSVVDASVVPPATRAAFNRDFSGAMAIEWQRNNSTSFTVQFNHNNQRHDARFDDNGHSSSLRVICFEAAVPQTILDAFRRQFVTDNVYEWNWRNDGTWKAHFLRNSVKYEATFSATGVLLKFEKSA